MEETLIVPLVEPVKLASQVAVVPLPLNVQLVTPAGETPTGIASRLRFQIIGLFMHDHGVTHD